MPDTYLDIETDGEDLITVIGIVTEGSPVRQLADEDVTADHLIEALPPSGRLFTFNGDRFDIPKIAGCLGIDLRETFESVDLMKVGWAHDLAGGQKSIEDQLGFGRSLPGMAGLDAIRLWHEYVDDGSGEAMETLLAYNAEDLEGMRYIRARLESTCCITTHGDPYVRHPRHRSGSARVATAG